MICEVVLPIVFIIIGLLLVTIKFLNEYPKLELNTGLYFEPSDVVMSNANGVDFASINNNFVKDEINIEYYAAKNIEDWDNANFDKRNDERLGSYFVGN